MKFAFLILGDFCPETDRAAIHGGAAQMRGVSTLEDACAAARELLEQGVGCIELCGAFGPDGARRIIEATGNRIPVGYVTHLPEQEAVYRAAFPNDLPERRSERPREGAALLGRTPFLSSGEPGFQRRFSIPLYNDLRCHALKWNRGGQP